MDNNRILPPMLQLNAWCGSGRVEGGLRERSNSWTLLNAPPAVRGFLRAQKKTDLSDWGHADVGWGLVLPDNPQLTAAQSATACDAPPAIQELVSRRGSGKLPAPVLRYRPGARAIGFLRRNGADLPVSESTYGTAPYAVPRYLLIYASPEQIPWEVQYSLNATRFVGRLSLTGQALDNYVAALLNNWQQGAADPNAALVWASDHGIDDITTLMRLSIAEPMVSKLRGDATVGPGTHYLNGCDAGGATAAGLAYALAQHRPGLIVTTSHGMTGPLDDIEKMRAQLGLLVDSAYGLVQPADLLEHWRPGGAIWYAHACCGAGSAAATIFSGLMAADSPARMVLDGVARCGERTAPMPMALLGAADPLRAFIGHVEPTFNWTLEQPDTLQFTTEPLTAGLYNELFQPSPVGMSMAGLYARLGGLYIDYERALRIPSQPEMLYRLLIARDIQSTVILGDPTAILPI
jgi:hypothetical protein